MAYPIITRAEAMAQGLPRYFTGKPCKRGHIAERYVEGGCIPCRLAQNERWRLANLDKRKASADAWREKNAEHLTAHLRQYHAKWYAANRESKLAANKAYREANPEKARNTACESVRKWQAKNPDRAKSYAAKWYADPENRAVHSNRRRALVRNAEGTHTPADLRAILEAQDHRCAYCQTELTPRTRHVDHILALARGGSNGRENLQYLCATCNLRKGTKDPGGHLVNRPIKEGNTRWLE